MNLNMQERHWLNTGKSAKLSFKFDLQAYVLILAFLVIILLFGVLTNGEFLSSRNISNLFTQMSVIALLAIGMTLILIVAHIDLSVGSVVGLTGGIAAILQVWYGWSTWAVVLAAILIGALIGLWQGWWVAYRGVPAFIVTLAGMLIFRGILIGLTRGQTIAPLENSFKAIGNSYLPYALGYILGLVSIVLWFFFTYRNRKKRIKLGLMVPSAWSSYGKTAVYAFLILLIIYMLNRYFGVPIPILIVVVFGGIIAFVSHKTSFGRYLYAIGGNAEAAALSGINIRRNTLFVFIIMGVLAATAGILLTGRLNAATTSAGTSFEMDAIAACVIGGTSLMGGKGNVIRSILGALIMASIDNGMSMMNMEAFWQYIVKGTILLLAVWIDIYSQKRAA
ncbi:MAG: sugar ABC transporter permease [Caldibacillus debilis]|jgi:D-xylose transport system permease protein|uniref:Xylose transport system permease protein XylH n=1 Tax=Caldibacillus debilis TaxID=301148 RepID=A0A3E0JZW2_9BACI|nr:MULTISPECIES: sugar ABC transporter permease [Bacillaceae]MBO2482665.1 sugar ABC transporter permease [Bacillaceae bacterium]MBY6270945.1 sugar ABC transporter permease [Bacillaceae bacterium]OUM86973.1 MAG: sugar ABC transporter permease [Parageobacillus thermoglucosidasius]REJ13509.1 MAG: sugar ABC transporter permease [Caldibacillus debilis]REJ25170.1 MAG: sugar ABC transporter permease [Caldibacillus debilis]